MDSLDIRNLYAAYRSVYEDQQSLTEDVDVELDESKADKTVPAEHRSKLRNARAGFQVIDPNSATATKVRRREHKERRGMRGNIGGEGASSYRYDDNHDKDYPSIKLRGKGYMEEELDVYDLVLDHLLDEGYCDDAESAEVIMANMSEEWLEEILDEANRGERHYNLSPEDVHVRRTRASASDRRAAEQWKQHDSGRNALTAKMTRGTGGNEQGNPKVKRGNSVFYDRTASHDSKRGVKKRKGQKTAQMRGPNPNVANHYAVKGRED
jgi:hypothetical protein